MLAPPRSLRGDVVAWLLAAGLCAVLVLPRASAAEPGHDRDGDAGSAPRLSLPGGHIVRAGEALDLAWSRADSIRELEILLSTDGGRHYASCISPRLDPGVRHFRWRVPADARGELRLRIRFNRGGREIEGAPTAALDVARSGDGSAEPLALPPAAGGGPEGPGRSAGRDAPLRGLAWGTGERASDSEADPRLASPATPASLPARARGATSPAAIRPLPRTPRFVPLRA